METLCMLMNYTGVTRALINLLNIIVYLVIPNKLQNPLCPHYYNSSLKKNLVQKDLKNNEQQSVKVNGVQNWIYLLTKKNGILYTSYPF